MVPLACLGRMPDAMKEPRVAIGGLLLPDVPGWDFTARDGIVHGTPAEGPGHLQILQMQQNNLPQPVTHEFCLLVLRLLLKTGSDPTDRVLKESVCGPYGTATFVRAAKRGEWDGEDEVIRTWYCRRPSGILFGVFNCKRSAMHEPACERESKQCDWIMEEALFDRVGWGLVDDPLTQVIKDHFDRRDLESGQA